MPLINNDGYCRELIAFLRRINQISFQNYSLTAHIIPFYIKHYLLISLQLRIILKNNDFDLIKKLTNKHLDDEFSLIFLNVVSLLFSCFIILLIFP